MLGPLFVYPLFIFSCIWSLVRPAIGLIAFYGFVVLDPAWNWRWSIDQTFQYQRYIFASLVVGCIPSFFQPWKLAPETRRGLVCLGLFFAFYWVSAQRSISPRDTQLFMSVFWKVLLACTLGILFMRDAKYAKLLLLAGLVAQGYNALQINLDYFRDGICIWADHDHPWGTKGVRNNGYSLITLPMLGASLAFGMWETKRIWKLTFLGIALLQLHEIMLLSSRGCMLGAVVCLLVTAWKMPRTRANWTLVAAGVVCIAILAGPSVMSAVKSSFASRDNRDTSADSRLYLWEAGWKITKEHPLLGVGPNAARKLVPKSIYYKGGLEQSSKALHNLYFDVSTSAGLPALACFCGFIFIPLHFAYKNLTSDNTDVNLTLAATLIGLPGYMFASNFSSGVLFETSYIPLVATYTAMNAIASNTSRRQPDGAQTHSALSY